MLVCQKLAGVRPLASPNPHTDSLATLSINSNSLAPHQYFVKAGEEY